MQENNNSDWQKQKAVVKMAIWKQTNQQQWDKMQKRHQYYIEGVGTTEIVVMLNSKKIMLNSKKIILNNKKHILNSKKQYKEEIATVLNCTLRNGK